jgi:hypothetical protein
VDCVLLQVFVELREKVAGMTYSSTSEMLQSEEVNTFFYLLNELVGNVNDFVSAIHIFGEDFTEFIGLIVHDHFYTFRIEMSNTYIY